MGCGDGDGIEASWKDYFAEHAFKRLCIDIPFLIRLLMYAMETFRASSSGGGHMLLRDEEPADPTVVLH